MLATVIAPIQLTPAIAADLAAYLRAADSESERHQQQMAGHYAQRAAAIASRLDRAYEDFVAGRLSEALWRRKSQEWEQEAETIERKRQRLEHAARPDIVSAEKILELAKQAENLYRSQDPTEQRRLLETVLSN